ncbi:MAG: DUF58 domain-containing protein [Acidilobaceae archaeon]
MNTTLPSSNEAVVFSTNRVLAPLIIASYFIVLDVFKISSLGWVGFSIVVFVLVLRAYSLIAALMLASCKVSVRAEGSEEGKPLRLNYLVCNGSLLPIALVEFSLSYPEHLSIKGAPGGLSVISPRGCFEYKAEFESRPGSHVLGPLRATYRDPFGFFRSSEITLGDPIVIKITPRIEQKISKVVLSTSRSTGLTRTRRPGEGVEFYSVRNYSPGDELRRILWHALTKGKLIVKEYERESSLYALFVLITCEDMIYGPYLNTPLEHSMRVLGSIVRHLANNNDNIALAVSTPKREMVSNFYPGRKGFVELMRLLSEIDFQDFKIRESSEQLRSRLFALEKRLSKILPRDKVNVIVVTTARIADVAAEALKGLSNIRGVSLNFFVFLPHLYGVEELSEFERAVYRVRTYQEIREAFSKTKDLRKRGFRAVVVTPRDMATKILMKLEAQRGV